MSVNDLAKLAKMDRTTVSRAEKDEPTVVELTYSRLERALNDFEYRMGAEDLGEQEAAAPPAVEQISKDPQIFRMVVKRARSDLEVTFEGPMEAADAVRRQAEIYEDRELERERNRDNNTSPS